MAHNCYYCDDVCYCDMDDTYGLEQPDDCRHLTNPAECSANEEPDDYDSDDFDGDEEETFLETGKQ